MEIENNTCLKKRPRIVGYEEINRALHDISINSPMAQGLLKKKGRR
ncbi:MAG: GreA/GreB family elongation factor [Fulvivirga sp.]